jgi:hypothetical protein
LSVQLDRITLVVNRRLSARQALALVRVHARRHNLVVIEMVGRGKGSHRLYQLVGRDGQEVVRFGLTDHPGDMSAGLVRRLEQRLGPVFGPKWTEKGR